MCVCARVRACMCVRVCLCVCDPYVSSQGKVTVLSSVLVDFPPNTKSLWKNKPCPFVYMYDKISGLNVCIDARSALPIESAAMITWLLSPFFTHSLILH